MAHLVHVGNSLGIRIPKAIIAQVGFKEDTDLVFKITDDGLLISTVHPIREGWAEAFKTSKKDDKNDLFMEEKISNEFDKDEWEW